MIIRSPDKAVYRVKRWKAKFVVVLLSFLFIFESGFPNLLPP